MVSCICWVSSTRRSWKQRTWKGWTAVLLLGRVRAQLAPLVDVVVAGRDLPPRRRLTPADLALRRIPARYAPVGAA